MAKIDRVDANYLAFALNALAGERTVFNDVIDSDTLDDNMNADFLRGWGIVGTNEFPTKQDFNASFFTLGQTLAYLHQMGISEWNTNQEYFDGSLAIGSNSVTYRSTADGNIGVDPVGDMTGKWKTAFSLSASSIRNVSADDSAVPSDDVIILDGTSNTVDFTMLSAANSSARAIKIQRLRSDPGTFAVQILPDGAETLGGEASIQLLPGESVELIPDGGTDHLQFP